MNCTETFALNCFNGTSANPKLSNVVDRWSDYAQQSCGNQSMQHPPMPQIEDRDISSFATQQAISQSISKEPAFSSPIELSAKQGISKPPSTHSMSSPVRFFTCPQASIELFLSQT